MKLPHTNFLKKVMNTRQRQQRPSPTDDMPVNSQHPTLPSARDPHGGVVLPYEYRRRHLSSWTTPTRSFVARDAGFYHHEGELLEARMPPYNVSAHAAASAFHMGASHPAAVRQSRHHALTLNTNYLETASCHNDLARDHVRGHRRAAFDGRQFDQVSQFDHFAGYPRHHQHGQLQTSPISLERSPSWEDHLTLHRRLHQPAINRSQSWHELEYQRPESTSAPAPSPFLGQSPPTMMMDAQQYAFSRQFAPAPQQQAWYQPQTMTRQHPGSATGDVSFQRSQYYPQSESLSAYHPPLGTSFVNSLYHQQQPQLEQLRGRVIASSSSECVQQPPTGQLRVLQLDGDENTAHESAKNYLRYHDQSIWSSQGTPLPSSEQLVLDSDQLLLTDYFFNAMKQLRKVKFTEADRKTRGRKRENVALGYGGLQCVHCAGKRNGRKFFWSNVDRLANSFAEISTHIRKCQHCPEPVKRCLAKLHLRHARQMSLLPRGSQKQFFRMVWRRLHYNADLNPESQASSYSQAFSLPTRRAAEPAARPSVSRAKNPPSSSLPTFADTGRFPSRAEECAESVSMLDFCDDDTKESVRTDVTERFDIDVPDLSNREEEAWKSPKKRKSEAMLLDNCEEDAKKGKKITP